jgi:hypothetical protein
MSGLEAQAARAAGAAAGRLAARLAEALPGVTVTQVAGGVELSGRGLSRRVGDEPALRWPAGVLR